MGYNKEEITTFAFEKGYTTWDFFEMLKVKNEKEYAATLHGIFFGNTLEYTYFCDQVSLNDTRYIAKRNCSITITPEKLEKMVDEGSNKIDLLRFFGITGTIKLYRKLNNIFGDDEKRYLAFRKKLDKNTTKFINSDTRS